MSTRSRIAVKVSDNEFKSIYCHWDGYPSNNGEKLIRYYRDDIEKILGLMELGDLSVLDARIDKPENHNFDNRVEDYCLAYHRDRNDEKIECSIHKTINGVIEQANNTDAEWIYLYDCQNKKWFYQSMGTAYKYKSKTVWLPLTKKNIKIAKKEGY